MAIESATGPSMFYIMIMLALGSALTVLFWARWAGILLATRVWAVDVRAWL